MNCEICRERLADDPATANESEVSAHLQSCAACRETLAKLRALDSEFRRWETPAASPDFESKLRARLAPKQAKPNAAMKWLMPLLAAAAAFAITLILPDRLPQLDSLPVTASQSAYSTIKLSDGVWKTRGAVKSNAKTPPARQVPAGQTVVRLACDFWAYSAKRGVQK